MRSAWVVVAGTFVSQIFVVGFFTYSVSILIPLIREEFSVGLEHVMYSLAAGTFLALFLVPLAGVLLDRYSARWIMSGGTLMFSFGLWVLSGVSTITQYIVVFGITMSLANSFAGSIACQTTVSRWFTQTRGRALGVSAVGTSVGGILVPALIAIWLPEYGWRVTLQNLSLIIALGVFPFVLFTISDKPDDNVPIKSSAETQQDSIAENKTLSFKEIIRNPSYWYIGLALGLIFSAYSATLSTLIAYATYLDIQPTQSSKLIMVIAIMGIIGKLAFGFAADKVNLKFGLWGAMAMVFTALSLLAAEPSYQVIFTACLLIGLAAGGMLPVWGAMMAKSFGLVSYGRAMGLMSPLITIIVIPGFAMMGRLFDMSGSYQLGLSIFAGMVLLASLLLIPLKITSPPSPI